MVKYKERLDEQKVFIDGEWTASSKGDTYSIINPSTGKTFVECQKCDVEDAKRAIDAARDAFDNGPYAHGRYALWRIQTERMGKRDG